MDYINCKRNETVRDQSGEVLDMFCRQAGMYYPVTQDFCERCQKRQPYE